MTILFTPSCIKKVSSLVQDDDAEFLYLRISISGGGCSGFKYNFNFESEIVQDDIIFPLNDKMKCLIDPFSIQYLDQSTIDYEDNGLNGAQFVIANPANAKSTCGCGQSFSA